MADGEIARHMEPPSNIEAEAAVIGAILYDNSALDRVRECLTAEDFYAPSHGLIYERACGLVSEGRVADGVTLRACLEQEGALAEIGGASYLADCLKAAAFGQEVTDYARWIAEFARRRALIEAGRGLASAAQIEASDACLEAHEAALDNLRSSRTNAQPVLTAADITFERDTRDCVPTGYPSIDRDIAGLARGAVTVLAGRPSMGKSAIAIDILVRMARDGRTVGYFSLEMPASDVKLRACLFSAWHDGQTGPLPTISDVVQGRAYPEQMARLQARQAAPEMRRFYVCDRGGMSVADMGAQLRLWNRHAERQGVEPPSVICVDHMGHALPGGGRANTLYEKTSMVSNQLLAMARNQGVAVLALSQLNRASLGEKRRPGLQDLRDSGKVEEDAATVLLLHREDYYAERAAGEEGLDDEERQQRLERLDRVRGRAELIIGKNRNGPLGVVELRHSVGHNVFRDVEWRTP